MSGDDLYEGSFEHSGTGRDVDIWLERDPHTIGLSYLVLSVSGARVMSAVDTILGGQGLWNDIEALKHHLTKVQDAIAGRVADLIVKEES